MHHLKNFLCSIEETEIHGVNHYPHLEYYIKKSKIKDIVLTSLFCLPIEKQLRNRLLKKATKNKKTIHFALENTNTNMIKENEIGKYFERVISAYRKINDK